MPRQSKKSSSGEGEPAIRISKGGSGAFAYRKVRDAIVSLELAPGRDLDEAELVARLHISRTPLREALVRLAAEGLVEILPNRGARVAPMAWDDIREHLEAFELGQRLVTRWAALRRSAAQLAVMERECEAFEAAAGKGDAEAMIETNWRFHAAIAAACQNRVIEQFYLRLLTANLRISRLAMSYECFDTQEAYTRHVSAILKEHREMVAAIAAQDADRGDKLGQSHADLARRRVTERLTQSLQPGMMLPLAS